MEIEKYRVNKMDELILIVIGIIAILVVLGVILTIIVLKKKQVEKYKEPDYKAFFIMGITFFIIGITFIPIGIVFLIAVSPVFISFIAMGLCYMVIGFANKDKWERKG